MYAMYVYGQPLYVKKEAGKRLLYMKTVRQQDLVIPRRVTRSFQSCAVPAGNHGQHYLWANTTGRIISQRNISFRG